MNFVYFSTILCLIFVLTSCSDNKKIVRAQLESCPGCSLNRLHDVKKFAYEDIPKYDNVVFKKIQGHPPEMVFLNQEDEEVERHPLKELNRKECNALLEAKGFKIRENTNEL